MHARTTVSTSGRRHAVHTRPPAARAPIDPKLDAGRTSTRASSDHTVATGTVLTHSRLPRSEVDMKPRRLDDYRPARSVVPRVGDELRAGRREDPTPHVRRVVGLDDRLSPVLQPA